MIKISKNMTIKKGLIIFEYKIITVKNRGQN